MKDIKELIYAAVEENAVAFQELAGGILQARAYDAIESLRPEIGASMFGESSHMKSKDDEDEEMEDEEDEDEEEMDDKKKSMKEALVGKQHEIDVDGNKKINAKDFAKLRAMKKNEEVEQIDETSLEKAHNYIRAAQHRLYNPASTKTSPQRAAKLEKGIERAHKSGGGHTVLVHKAHIGNLQKTVDALKQYHGGNGQHPITVHPPSGKYGPDHAEIHIPRSSSTGRNIESIKHTLSRANDGKPVTAAIVHHDTGEMHRISEGFDQIDEDAKATVDALKKVHGDHNFHVDKKGEIGHAYLKPSHVKKLVTALNTPGKGKGMIDGMMEEVEQIDEVDHPKNQADMLAHILHQVKIAGHPFATDAQFRATTVGKDASKKASLEPGADQLQYAIAQGGNVKP